MNNFVKMDIAIEFMADKISKTTNQLIQTNDIVYQNELSNLSIERDKIYSGDIETINKIINEYEK